MSLTDEWKLRLNDWRTELLRHFFRPLGAVALSGFVTREQLTARQAMEREFRPMPAGTKWGMNCEYGWFRGTVALPEAAAGRRIVLRMGRGEDSAIYVNVRAAGAIDHFHHEVTLTTRGVAGEKHEILIETYAGNGPRVVKAGPIPLDRETVPEVTSPQAEVRSTTFGIWEEDAYQLWIDVRTLTQLRDNLNPDSMRVVEIDRALKSFAATVDFEVPHEEMMATVGAARELLKPALACVNGTTAPTLYCFGHAHLDVAWLWPLAETERKCVRTLSTQLALLEEYPEYKFLQSQPHLYRMVKSHYPDLYERVKEAVKSGRFLPEGGMWVEPDTNMAGGEALIRHFIHGKRFFREEFGVECEFLWLPDVFGYSGALPQIILGCGMKYFATAKILWAYNYLDSFPYNIFWWEGIDGSKVLSHLCGSYGYVPGPSDLIRCWQNRLQKDDISSMIVPFGWGDGGGGATRDHLEFLRRQKDLEGSPRTVIASPNEFFHDVEARGGVEAKYVGEIYFPSHRGTYTSQGRVKKGNRKSELALREAEMWAMIAKVLGESKLRDPKCETAGADSAARNPQSAFRWPAAQFDELWKTVLLNQFHDILPGSSIRQVCEEAAEAHRTVIAAARRTAEAAAKTLTKKDDGAVTVLNSLSWERTALFSLPKGFAGAQAANGSPLPAQTIGEETLAEVTIPSCGWTTVRSAGASAAIPNELKAGERFLENEFLRVEFNDKGEIASIFDKESGREIAAGLCNSFKMYKDVPSSWDAWDIDSIYTLTPVELNEPAAISPAASGPLVAALRVLRPIHQSTMTQTISLRRDSRRMDFQTTVDWRERHKLLKVAFPVDIRAHEAIHEIQFGHIRRTNHKSRPYDMDRFEVCNHRWTALAEENRGFAVLNDCKYGVNVADNSINLTLLKAPLAPDMHADQGLHEFTYAFYAWNGSLGESNVVREGYDLNCPVMAVAGDGGVKSVFSLDAANVVLETVKPAEDGSDDIILRLYESKRMTTRCSLVGALPVRSACETDMLEMTSKAEIPYVNDDGEGTLRCRLTLDFRPFEIKTVRLRMG